MNFYLRPPLIILLLLPSVVPGAAQAGKVGRRRQCRRWKGEGGGQEGEGAWQQGQGGKGQGRHRAHSARHIFHGRLFNVHEVFFKLFN